MFAAQFFEMVDARAVFRKWRDFAASAPDEISSLGFFWTVPRVDAFPKELQGRRVFLYGALYAGPVDEGEKALRPLMGIGKPVLDLSGRGPYTQWQSAFDPFFVTGGVYSKILAYWKSIYLNGLDDTLIDDLVDHTQNLPSEQCLVAIWQLGGAMARVAEEATAFGKRIVTVSFELQLLLDGPKPKRKDYQLDEEPRLRPPDPILPEVPT